MARYPLAFAATLILLGCLQVTAHARHLESWPYQRLFKESDCVVLATALDTEKSNDSFVDDRWPFEFDGTNTTFKIQHVLKGEVPGKKIKVVHYQFGKPRKDSQGNLVIAIDGPCFVRFCTEPARIEGPNRLIDAQPEYLLFLRKLADGRFEPVSGKVDPQLSVKEIFEPLAADLDK